MKQQRNIKTQEQLEIWYEQFRKIPIPENGWAITWTEFKNSRSLAQNRLLWRRVYQPIAEQLSETTGALVKKQTIHEFLKDLFGTRGIIRVLGEVHSYPKSTTQYTKAEMSDYMEKCFAWGTSNGVWFDG